MSKFSISEFLRGIFNRHWPLALKSVAPVGRLTDENIQYAEVHPFQRFLDNPPSPGVALPATINEEEIAHVKAEPIQVATIGHVGRDKETLKAALQKVADLSAKEGKTLVVLDSLPGDHVDHGRPNLGAAVAKVLTAAHAPELYKNNRFQDDRNYPNVFSKKHRKSNKRR